MTTNEELYGENPEPIPKNIISNRIILLEKSKIRLMRSFPVVDDHRLMKLDKAINFWRTIND